MKLANIGVHFAVASYYAISVNNKILINCEFNPESFFIFAKPFLLKKLTSHGNLLHLNAICILKLHLVVVMLYDNSIILNPHFKVYSQIYKSKAPKYVNTQSTKRTLDTPVVQNIGRQLDLTYDKNESDSYIRQSKSALDISSSQANKSSYSFEKDYAMALRDKHFYSQPGQRKWSPDSSSQKIASNSQKFTTLPVTKTLVHNKPWSPGKVDASIYYPYRDSKITSRKK